MKQKEIGAILYLYYMDNYCEDEFNFDNGEELNKIKAYYNKMKSKYKEEEIEKIKEEIRVYEKSGTDYDVLEFVYEEMSDLMLQVTSLIDYDGNKVSGYTGDYQWADVGMFFIDYTNVLFDDLKE